ncbi:type II toxin-antitoxin system HicB family antitoxin [Methanosarcina acetivorans]|uniref:type II toxin-antitoxin system HicB family antitoxin n=1 Tax=Methanosarcina acetivorans TaxID=2214 RepID=UPI000A0077AF|nr:type II toxin-antitoxin system HicB family antitoxin [Methanosarcina acetivorans]
MASCPGFPGCFSQGDTVEEFIENQKRAIQVCLESCLESFLKSFLKSCLKSPAEDELRECIGKCSLTSF